MKNGSGTEKGSSNEESVSISELFLRDYYRLKSKGIYGIVASLA